LIRIVNGRLPWAWIDEEKALPWVEKRSGLQLADSQRGAIRLALTAKALVITGGPGCQQDDDRQFDRLDLRQAL
jgi:exodeoxyribonuclease V alpha subunit